MLIKLKIKKLTNINREYLNISKEERASLKNQKATVIWFTGLSGSGKSTLATKLDKYLFELGYHTYVLDGDNIRSGINKELTFSSKDRTENIRRISEISKLFIDAGLIVICSSISPYTKDREAAKNRVGADNFIEIYLSTPIEVCELRDVKGLYAKARNGEIKNLTGIDAPYEKPSNPFIELNTAEVNTHDSIQRIMNKIEYKIKR